MRGAVSKDRSSAAEADDRGFLVEIRGVGARILHRCRATSARATKMSPAGVTSRGRAAQRDTFVASIGAKRHKCRLRQPTLNQ
jgi:hypothetical protein